MNKPTPLQNPQRPSSDWWRGAVIYQIYPRSFQDSNGDGVGDLKGIIQRLDYIADLGVDAIWISPFFQSPMKDFGYDVSDYQAVDPLFGNMQDFDDLLVEAHKRGVRVMIDLVLSHSSDQHLWFQESRQDRNNAKSDWYVWVDPQPDGTPPNNWLSIFGGSAWQWDTIRQQYYLHNFLASQPDLNFHTPDVQNTLLDMTRFWLDKGVDGFRLDTINFYVHDQQLRNNPALSIDRRNDSIAPETNPYNHQEHLYSKNRPENLDFLARFRSLLDEYEGRTALGEIGDAQYGLEIMGQYTSGNSRIHMCYAFEFLETRPATADWISEVLQRLGRVASDGWPCWAFSNHDVMRHKSRWNLSDDALKTYAMLMMCLRGSACLYQGEEVGFHQADVPLEDIQDPYGIEFWPEFKGRDGCRTPMIWHNASNEQYAGFSTAKPWLPINENDVDRSALDSTTQADSLYNHYKSAIALRRKNPALTYGTQEILQTENDVLTFIRRESGKEILCVFNLSVNTQSTALPDGEWHSIADGISNAVDSTAEQIELDTWCYFIGIKKGKGHGKH